MLSVKKHHFFPVHIDSSGYSAPQNDEFPILEIEPIYFFMKRCNVYIDKQIKKSHLCERSAAIHTEDCISPLDCFVAFAPRNDATTNLQTKPHPSAISPHPEHIQHVQ